MMNEEYISDDEIRVIGSKNHKPKSPFLWRWVWLIIVLITIIGIVAWVLWPKAVSESDTPSVFEQEVPHNQSRPLSEWINSLDSISVSGTTTKDDTINEIPLRVYVPFNSTPHLEVGYNVLNRKNDQILFFQAADIRGDNFQIVGAFVQEGKLVSRGMSKRGYCAIINNKVTVGVSENSPLLEQAIERNGDFFRQYPLVDNGTLVESELKNKSRRRALCEIDSRIAVIESQTKESMHDFAQALVDLGVNNAIYLVGGDAIGWSMDTEGQGTEIGLWDKREYKNANFIVWPKE